MVNICIHLKAITAEISPKAAGSAPPPGRGALGGRGAGLGAGRLAGRPGQALQVLCPVIRR